jgi:hypothetical protein
MKEGIDSNRMARALLVRELAERYYEAGRHDRSMRAVYRKYVRHVFPVSERTFWAYLRITKKLTIDN